MSTSAYTRIPVIILAALALAACPFKKEKKHDETPAVYYVSTSDGSDTNPGTQNSKFKRITHAMSVATRSGTTVHVAPGTYGSNETFPIRVPEGVLLIGDEPNKGGGSAPTSIVGGGLAPDSTPGDVGVAVLPGQGSTIAGFTITNDASQFAARRGLILGKNTVTLRNNTITGATHQVAVYIDASANHVITGNRIVDNGAGSGLAFAKGGVGSKVESNDITGNAVGVEYDVAGGDLGGGSAHSAGLNVLSCNTQSDLKAAAPTAIAIFAAGNFWDRSPPMFGCNAGDDICLGTATITGTPYAQASSPCVPAARPILFVDASALDHTGNGTQSSPFKSITDAISVATSGSTIQVAPGIYDAVNIHEVFPIRVPDGVLVIGDELNKGGGSTPTSIVGGDQLPSPFPVGVSAAVHPGAGSTIAGFTITNDNPAFNSGRYGVYLSNSTVTLRNNTVTGASHGVGVYVSDDGGTPPTPSMNHVITGNRIVGNGPSSGEGLGFISGGAGSKVENNVITGNGFGVDYEVADVDLGGGSVSAGGNTISCNSLVDLYVGIPGTISAKNNLWDHIPTTPVLSPTPACNFTGDDFCNASATVDTTNAAVAPSHC